MWAYQIHSNVLHCLCYTFYSENISIEIKMNFWLNHSRPIVTWKICVTFYSFNVKLHSSNRYNHHYHHYNHHCKLKKFPESDLHEIAIGEKAKWERERESEKKKHTSCVNFIRNVETNDGPNAKLKWNNNECIKIPWNGIMCVCMCSSGLVVCVLMFML